MAVDSITRPGRPEVSRRASAFVAPPSWRRRVMSIAGLTVLLMLVIIGATAAGSADISPAEVGLAWLNRLSGISMVSAVGTIVMDIRLPRALLAALVGAALAVAGAAYQGLFRNPLADPYLIGVAQGGALGATAGFLIPGLALAAGIWSIPLLAFAGGLMAAAVVYLVAKVGKTVPVTTLILAGVALGALLSSVTSYLMIRAGDQLHGIVFWLMGRLSVGSWDQVAVVAPYALVGITVLWFYARPLNVMQLDDEQAQQLGINVERVKLILLGAATLATAAAVAFCGIIGFIGIIVPHFVRLVWGPDHRFLIPLSALCGAIFLILADTLARTVLAPVEVPVGVVTAVAGAPFFLWLLRRQKRMVF